MRRIIQMYQEDIVVRTDQVVTLEYTLRFDDGELAADSAEDGLLMFIQGHGHVFPIIEEAIEGLRVDDELELVLPPGDTYGEYDPEAVELFPFEMFPDDLDVYEGLEVELFDEDTGAEMEAVVAEIVEDGVVVDLNHPLAGETLTMRLLVVGIRPATAEEIAHDHVHEDGDGHGDGPDIAESGET
jgi:FKBP-type peptidyl-prolyl cis-trans isomerase SlyD